MFLRLIPIILFSVLLGCENSPPPTRTYTHSGLGLLAAAISPDGDNALISTVDLGVQYWDLKSEKVKFKIAHHGEDQEIIAMALAKEAPIAVSLSANSLGVWDTRTGQAYRYLKLEGSPTSIAISNTGKYALVGFVNYHAKLIDVTRGEVLRRFKHADIVNTVELTNNNELAIIGSDDTAVRVWDLNTGEMRFQWFHPSKVTHLSASPNNRYLLNNSSQHKAWIHDLSTGQMVSELSLAPKYNLFRTLPPSVSASLFTNNSQTLITGHPPRTIKVWDVKTGELKNTIQLPKRTAWKPSASVALAFALDANETVLTVETSNGQGYQYLMSDII